MTNTGIETKTHPEDTVLAGFLDKSISAEDRQRVEAHVAACGDCLKKLVSAYESVRMFTKGGSDKKEKTMKKINIYLVLAVISFMLSFAAARYFIQLLVATLLLGAKWIADSKSTRMLVMIYEAWKKGGEKEASKILETLDKGRNRF